MSSKIISDSELTPSNLRVGHWRVIGNVWFWGSERLRRVKKSRLTVVGQLTRKELIVGRWAARRENSRVEAHPFPK